MIDLLPLVAAASSVKEYDAARMIADALATELADAKPLWSRLRAPLAELARTTAAQCRTDARLLPDEDAELFLDFARDLDAAADTIMREHAREWWILAKRAKLPASMASAWRAYSR